MARMVLDQPAGLPAGQIAEALRRNFPEYRWQVGDGPQDGILPLDRPASIFGRGPAGVVLLGIELVAAPLDDPAAPPHRLHVRLSGPSTDDRGLAERLLAIVGQALAEQGGGAMQFDEDGPWAGRAELAARAAAAGILPTPPSGDPVQPFPASPPDPPDPPRPQAFPRGSGNDRPLFGRKKV